MLRINSKKLFPKNFQTNLPSESICALISHTKTRVSRSIVAGACFSESKIRNVTSPVPPAKSTIVVPRTGLFGDQITQPQDLQKHKDVIEQVTQELQQDDLSINDAARRSLDHSSYHTLMQPVTANDFRTENSTMNN